MHKFISIDLPWDHDDFFAFFMPTLAPFPEHFAVSGFQGKKSGSAIIMTGPNVPK